MRLIFFGPPGSGKGTYASRLASSLGIPHIAIGDIFREMAKSKGKLAEKIRNCMEKGLLVPDEIVIKVIRKRLAKPDCEKGFILDGYPRTLAQAEVLEKIAPPDVVINFDVTENVILERLSGRRICRRCAAIYHIKFLKPKRAGVCDKCGGELYQRKDDTPKVIKERLRVDALRTRPLLEYYRKRGLLHRVSCERADVPPEVMVERTLNILKKLKLLS